MRGERAKFLPCARALLGRAAVAVALVTLKYWAFAPDLVEDLLRRFR